MPQSHFRKRSSFRLSSRVACAPSAVARRALAVHRLGCGSRPYRGFPSDPLHPRERVGGGERRARPYKLGPERLGCNRHERAPPLPESAPRSRPCQAVVAGPRFLRESEHPAVEGARTPQGASATNRLRLRTAGRGASERSSALYTERARQAARAVGGPATRKPPVSSTEAIGRDFGTRIKDARGALSTPRLAQPSGRLVLAMIV